MGQKGGKIGHRVKEKVREGQTCGPFSVHGYLEH